MKKQRKLAVLGATLLVLLVAGSAHAGLVLEVNPIQICNNSGAGCANPGLQVFSPESNKMWAQAGIEVLFNPFQQVNNASLLNVTGITEIAAAGNPGASADPLMINMWFVETIALSPTFYGEAWVNANGVVIGSQAVLNFNGGIGRLDTIAHELGHNLNLRHNNFGAGGANNLMTSGGSRTVPSSINDIYPDGLQLSQLTAAQIQEALRSRFVQVREDPVPEPSSIVLLLAGLGGLAVTRLGRRS